MTIFYDSQEFKNQRILPAPEEPVPAAQPQTDFVKYLIGQLVDRKAALQEVEHLFEALTDAQREKYEILLARHRNLRMVLTGMRSGIRANAVLRRFQRLFGVGRVQDKEEATADLLRHKEYETGKSILISSKGEKLSERVLKMKMVRAQYLAQEVGVPTAALYSSEKGHEGAIDPDHTPFFFQAAQNYLAQLVLGHSA